MQYREGLARCEKCERALCADCIRCQFPSGYCKYRNGCAIYFQWKEAEEVKSLSNSEREKLKVRKTRKTGGRKF